MPFKPREWMLEGHHPLTEANAMLWLADGKALVYKQLRELETWTTVEGAHHIYIAHQDNADNGAPAYFIHRLNEQGSESPEGSMMFHCLSWPINTPKYEFLETLELIAPLNHWMTAVRKEQT